MKVHGLLLIAMPVALSGDMTDASPSKGAHCRGLPSPTRKRLRKRRGGRYFCCCMLCLLLVANIFDCMFDSASAIPFEVPTHELRFLRLTVEPYFLKKPITVGFFGETDPSHQSRRVFFVRITHRSRIDDVVHCCPPKHRMADQTPADIQSRK